MLRAGSHFDIKSVRKICLNRGYINIPKRMAIEQAQFTYRESKMADSAERKLLCLRLCLCMLGSHSSIHNMSISIKK